MTATTAEADIVRPASEQAAPRPVPSTGHVPEIDWLKGFAILCVVGIHAKIFEDHAIHEYVINRAVPIFTILFGVTSELWWRRMATASTRDRLSAWYGQRLRRIYVPVWAYGAAWWGVLLIMGDAARFDFGAAKVFESFVGYSPWAGTSWFVALLIQAVVFYPVIRWGFVRLGPLVLPLTLLLCWWCGMHLLPIVDVAERVLGSELPHPGFYGYWIFLPRMLHHIAAGFLIAKWWSGRPPLLATALAALVAGVCVALIVVASQEADELDRNLHHQILFYYFDIPLTVALLGAFRFLRRFTLLTRFLTWCGLSSWGIYLGHTLVYELMHGLSRLTANANMTPETGSNGVRLLFAGFLFACGAGLTVAGSAVRRVVRIRVRPRAPVS